MCQFQLVARAPWSCVEKDSELCPSRLSRKCCDQLTTPASSTDVGTVTHLQICHPLHRVEIK